MEELTGIMKLLGEENTKRLQDGIADLLLEQVDRDIRDRYAYDYIIEFDDIFEEVKKQIKEEFKEKLAEKYRKLMDEKMSGIFGD